MLSLEEKKKKVFQLAKESARIHDLQIYDIEFKSSFVRVYLDKEKGVADLNACSKVMKSFLFLLESEGLGNIQCEVSSPGGLRPLQKGRHPLQDQLVNNSR